jgi:UDP-glucose 4-epimerase
VEAPEYVGSHACKMLALRGFEPITLDNLSRGNRWEVKWGPLEVGDIGNANRVREVRWHYQLASVMHFAAYTNAGESVAGRAWPLTWPILAVTRSWKRSKPPSVYMRGIDPL